jgi:hypothetical protein
VPVAATLLVRPQDGLATARTRTGTTNSAPPKNRWRDVDNFSVMTRKNLPEISVGLARAKEAELHSHPTMSGAGSHRRLPTLRTHVATSTTWFLPTFVVVTVWCVASGTHQNSNAKQHPLTKGVAVGAAHPINVTLALAHHPDDVELLKQIHRNVSEPG